MTDAAKKTSVFGFLKNIVAEDVPDAPAKRNTPVPPATHPSAHFGPHDTFGTPATPTAAPDAQALSKLEARLQKDCPQAYVAFMEQHEMLKEDITDERQRFKVALKTSHTTAVEVLGALDQLLGTMEKAHEEFVHSFDENKKKRIGEADQSIKASDDLIKSSEEQIQAIQEKITSLKTKRETDIANVKEETRRLDAILGGFNAAHAQVVHRLEDQKNRIASMPAASPPESGKA